MNADLVLEQLRVIGGNDIVTLKRQNHDDYHFFSCDANDCNGTAFADALVKALPAYGEKNGPISHRGSRFILSPTGSYLGKTFQVHG